jgi:hypothetical protein
VTPGLAAPAYAEGVSHGDVGPARRQPSRISHVFGSATCVVMSATRTLSPVIQSGSANPELHGSSRTRALSSPCFRALQSV